VCVELYLGLPLFPGVSQHNQLTRIVEMFGQPPDSLINIGKNSNKYFVRLASSLDASVHGHQSAHGSTYSGMTTNSASSGSETPSQYRLKTAEEYAKDTNTEVPVLKKYLRYSRLEDVIMKCSLPGKSRSWTAEQKQEEYQRRQSFLDFLNGMFRLHPFDRWTAKQAASHPFITNAPYLGPFIPAPDLKTNERKLSYMTHTQNDASKTKSAVRNSISGSIPRPIQQNQPSYLNAAPQLRTTTTAQMASASGNSDFLPLDRRRLSDPTNGSYLNSALMGPPSLATGQHGAIGSSKHAQTQDQARPMLKRGQSVLPRREDVCDQGVTKNSSDAFKRQNSSGSLERQHDQQMWSLSSNPETLPAYQGRHPNQTSVAYSQPLSNHHGSWQHQQQMPYQSFGQASDYMGMHQNPNMQSKASYENGGAVPDMNNGYHQAYGNPGMLSSSYLSSMSYSMTRAAGSMQEGRTHVVLTDFGQALMRPDMDERRRLQSMNIPLSQPYSPQTSHHYPMNNHQYTPTNTYNQRYLSNAGISSQSSTNHPQYSFSNRVDGNYLSNEFQSMMHSNSNQSMAAMSQSSSQSYHTAYGSMPTASMMSPMMSYSYYDQSNASMTQPHSTDIKISSSYQHAAQEASHRDNPLHSGYGFEHIVSESNSHRHLDEVNEKDSMELNTLKEAQIVADWDPFFQIDDVPNPGNYCPSQAPYDDQKDINDYL
jgi:hypothetical protein